MTDHVLEIVTGPETLDLIQRTLDDVWGATDVPAAARMRIELAVSEIASNIIEHARGGDSVTLSMGVTVRSDVVAVTFTDDGAPAAIDLTSVYMPDASSERHRGLAIAQSVLDELSYRSDEVGNHWTLTCRRCP